MNDIEFYTAEYNILKFIMNKQKNNNGNYANTSQDEIVKEFGYGKHRVNKCINLLIEFGYIKKEKPNGKGKYQVTEKGIDILNNFKGDNYNE